MTPLSGCVVTSKNACMLAEIVVFQAMTLVLMVSPGTMWLLTICQPELRVVIQPVGGGPSLVRLKLSVSMLKVAALSVENAGRVTPAPSPQNARRMVPPSLTSELNFLLAKVDFVEKSPRAGPV